jgi:hypothetical protein
MNIVDCLVARLKLEYLDTKPTTRIKRRLTRVPRSDRTELSKPKDAYLFKTPNAFAIE